MTDQIVCTVCPLGCIMEVEHTRDRILSVTGNRCKRGLGYAEKEILHPERTVTTTVRIRGGAIGLLPVKTSRSIAKDLVFTVMKEANAVCVNAPVKMGTVIIANIAGSGADLVATRTIEA